MSQPRPTDEVELRSRLQDTFLQNVIYHAQTDSTNTRAIELLASAESAGPVKSPCLVYAESQRAGRGRGANQWWSADGSLTFSLVIGFERLGLSAERKPLLPLLTGLAVLRVGEALLPDADFALKWPNDVYLAGRKLAGVLIEVPSQASGHAVIGVGLNVNNSFAHAPEDLASTSISLADQSGVQHNRMQVLRAFVKELEMQMDAFAHDEAPLRDWPQHCLLTGKRVTLRTGASQVTGICHGVDNSGALVLETDTGRQSFFGGVVQSWH